MCGQKEVLEKHTYTDRMKYLTELVKYMQRKDLPLVSIIILNYNGKDVLIPCLESVFRTNYPNYEVVLVDNASTDESAYAAKRCFSSNPRFKLIQNTANLGFCEGNNVGVRHSKGDYEIFLNNDTVIDPNWVNEIVEVIDSDDSIGAVQPILLCYDDPKKIDSAGGFIDFYGFSWGAGLGINVKQIEKSLLNSLSEIFFATGSAMVVRRAVLSKTGLFDPKFFIFNEDVDLSWRIRLGGYKIVLVPRSMVYHRISATVSRSPKLMWHFRKNRLSALIRNYSMKNLLRALPITLAFYFFLFVKELIKGEIEHAFSSLSAITYNLRSFKHQWQQRIIVQKQIRKVSDKEIVDLMPIKCVLFSTRLVMLSQYLYSRKVFS